MEVEAKEEEELGMAQCVIECIRALPEAWTSQIRQLEASEGGREEEGRRVALCC